MLVPVVQAVKGLAGGILAGLIGGAAGQVLFQVTGDLFHVSGGAGGAILESFFRILGWTILGSLAGLGLAFFMPNLRADKGLLGGAIGGAVGAVGFIVVALGMRLTIGSLWAPAWWTSWPILGAVLLGACIGLMVAIAERAFRTAWLEVRYGREVRTVNLGPEPVASAAMPRTAPSTPATRRRWPSATGARQQGHAEGVTTGR